MKRKILILSLIIMLITSVLSISALAATYNFTVSMTAKNSKVSAGSEVLITVKLSNLNVGENGINSFSAYLSYDTDVFETLTDSSVDGINGWVPSYTVGTGKVSLYRSTFLKTDEEIMQISLKTKADLQDGVQGEVKLSTIIVSNSSDEITASPVSTSITIGSENAGSDSTGATQINVTPSNVVANNTVDVIPQITVANNTVNTTANTTTNVALNTSNVSSNNTSNVVAINTTNNTTNQTVVANTESNNDMPYTGTDSSALARIIIGFVFIGLSMYIKIERMNKDIR